MRTFLVLSLLISAHTFAAVSDFEAKKDNLINKKQKDTDLFQLGVKYKPGGKFPAKDGYIDALIELKKQHLKEIKDLHAEECEKTKKYCLTEKEENLLAAQLRIDVELESHKNKWAQDKVSADERKKKVAELERAAAVELCAFGKDCDKLSEEDKKKAEAKKAEHDVEKEKGGSVVEIADRGITVPSEVVPDKKPEAEVAKPDAGKPGDAKPEEAKPDEKEEGRKPSEASEKAAEELTEALKKVEEELDPLEKELETKALVRPATKEVIDAAKALETKKVEATLKVLEELCKKYPNDKAVCKTKEEKKTLLESAQANTCFYERRVQYDSSADKSKVVEVKELSKHLEDWIALASPKECKTLLEKDKKPQASDEASTEDSNQEDENKRNYQSDKCVWVTNIPRKVVSGLNCGKTPNNICVGYVSCPRKQGGGVFTRMSTCRASYCGTDDAIKCTKDQGYWSRKPSGEDKEFVSPEVKRILKPAQATRQ